MSAISRRLREVARLAQSRRGGAIIIFGLSLPVLVGGLALGVEMGVAYVEKRQVQTQTDAAALAAAFELAKGNSSAMQKTAAHEAYRNGLDSTMSPSIVVNQPPKSGPYAGTNSAIEVIVTVQQPPMFSATFRTENLPITARAVAEVRSKANACVLATSTISTDAALLTGSAAVTLQDCALASNSETTTAIKLEGSTKIKADTLWTTGKIEQSSGATVEVKSPPTSDAWKIKDPYSGLTIPTLSACSATGLSVSKETTLTPGVYCQGLTFEGQGPVTLKPGTYYINQGDLQIKGQVKVRCDCFNPTDGVTFVLTDTANPANTGTVYIAGGTDVDLKAPTSNTYPFPGLLIYQDPRVTNPGPAKIEGGSTVLLAGGLHFSQEVQFAGNNTTNSTKCLIIIAKSVTFTGETNLTNSDCQAAGIKTATIEGIFLVE